MAPVTRRNSALAKKIATLQLHLAPLVPLPTGRPHPAFPPTLMAFHLLTEAELDSIAHYYHQSTPGPFTHQYPASMNWDKEFLAVPASSLGDDDDDKTPAGLRGLKSADSASRRLSVQEEEFLTDLMKTVEDLRVGCQEDEEGGEEQGKGNGLRIGNEDEGLSHEARVRIKRRKVGKFIGLVGMETPVEEIAGRIQASLDRAVKESRDDLRRREEVSMGRRKVG